MVFVIIFFFFFITWMTKCNARGHIMMKSNNVKSKIEIICRNGTNSEALDCVINR